MTLCTVVKEYPSLITLSEQHIPYIILLAIFLTCTCSVVWERLPYQHKLVQVSDHGMEVGAWVSFVCEIFTFSSLLVLGLPKMKTVEAKSAPKVSRTRIKLSMILFFNKLV